MTTYPAISLHQPWATLCATPVPCDCPKGLWSPISSIRVPTGPCLGHPMVKRFETRSRPCPPKYIGQRVAIHAAKRRPADVWIRVRDDAVFPPHLATLYDYGRCVDPQESNDGEWWRYRWAGPLGAVVATAVIATSLPIVHGHEHPDVIHVACVAGGLTLCANWQQTNITDQLPYGDWTPGRFAWELADVEPLAEPVPWKGRQGWFTVELP